MELSKNKLSQYAGLGQAKMRRKHGLFAVEGKKSVVDSLPFFKLEALVLVSDNEVDSTPEFADDAVRQKSFYVSESDMKKLSSLSTPPEVIAIFHLPEDNARDLDVDADKLYLMLDGVRDPGNMGTIVRTAHWFGITKIFASKDCVDIYNPKTIQSTMGSLGRVEVVYCDLGEMIEQNPDMPVYGTLLDGDNIYKTNLSESGFIIMGNEGQGISESIRGKITHKLLIPPYNPDNHSESLNVAIATGVILALFRR